MKFSEICEINPRSFFVGDLTEVSFVGMASVSDKGDICISDIRPFGEVKNGYTLFKNGDVLFAKITPCMENGKGALVIGARNGIGVGSSEFHVFRPIEGKTEGKWLYYLTTWSTFRKEAELFMTGSAGQKRVPKSFFDKYELSLPDSRSSPN